MAYASSDLTLAGDVSAKTGGLAAAMTSARNAIATYTRKRRVYVQTLTELQAYSRRDLLDLGIDPDALHAFARRAAGL